MYGASNTWVYRKGNTLVSVLKGCIAVKSCSDLKGNQNKPHHCAEKAPKTDGEELWARFSKKRVKIQTRKLAEF